MAADPAAAHKAGVATIHQSLTDSEHDSGREHHARPLAVAIRPHRQERTNGSRSSGSAQVALELALDAGKSTYASRGSTRGNRTRRVGGFSCPHHGRTTTSLSQREIDRMFLLVDDLKAKGMGIVSVSHWLEEVFRMADRITVLRDSKFIVTRPSA